MLSVPNTISLSDPGPTPYTAGVDYSAPANAVPNGLYAQTGPHPSELVVGDNEPSSYYHRIDLLQKDSVLNSTGLSILPTTATDEELVGGSTQSHMYAMGTCENLGMCEAGEIVGSPCSGELPAGMAQGYCYKSASGSLECGRMLSVTPRFSSTPILVRSTTSGTTPSRCPAGFPLTSPKTATSKMLLVGGCMIATDAQYRASAMVHVPKLCATPADLPTAQIGCIFPGALNYAPGAVQSSKCKYNLNGCTSPTALNYNSEAAVDDGSCVEPVSGCTLPAAGYAGVDATTPMAKGRYVGVPTPNTGLVPLPTYGSVLVTNGAANVLSGCTVVIEGCMDAEAVNYDPKANANTNTWCIPKVFGCMMPLTGLSKASVAATAGRTHTLDGGSGNWTAAFTVHNGKCTVGRKGCTTVGMFNYDAKATIDDGSCYPDLFGCLDKSAMNFNCTSSVSFAECVPTERASVPTKHEAGACNYALYSPPPPPPPYAADAITIEVVKIEMKAAGEVADYTPAVVDNMKGPIAAEAGVNTSAVDITVTAASVIIVVQIEAADAAAATTMETSLVAVMSTPEAATSFFAASGVDVQVISAPVIEATTVVVAGPPPPPPDTTGAMVGGIVGGIGGFLMLIGIIAGVRKMQKDKAAKATYPA
jgi:hypothetical protein